MKRSDLAGSVGDGGGQQVAKKAQGGEGSSEYVINCVDGNKHWWGMRNYDGTNGGLGRCRKGIRRVLDAGKRGHCKRECTVSRGQCVERIRYER